MTRPINFLATIFLFSQAFGEEPIHLEETTTGGYVLLSLTTLYPSIFLHEMGHAQLAKKYGAKDVQIHLSLFDGTTTYLAKGITDAERRNIALAGPITNRAIAGVTNQILNLSESTGTPAKWGAMFYFMNRSLVVLNWGLSLFWMNDFSESVHRISNNKRTRAALMGGYGAILGLDIWLCWDDILKNKERLIFGQTLPEENQTSFLLDKIKLECGSKNDFNFRNV